MVLVGSPGVYVNWEFKVLSLWSLGGSNMVNYLTHIYHWWIWLPDSILVDVGVICILGWCLNKISSLASFLGLAYLVEVSYFVEFLTLHILGCTFLSSWYSGFPHLMHFLSIPGGFWTDDCDLKILVLQNYSVPGSFH